MLYNMNCFGFSKDWIFKSISNEQIYFNTKSHWQNYDYFSWWYHKEILCAEEGSAHYLLKPVRILTCNGWIMIILQRISGIKNWPPNVELLIQILVPKMMVASDVFRSTAI